MADRKRTGREKKINDKNDGNTNATGQVIWRHAFLDKKKGNQLARNEQQNLPNIGNGKRNWKEGERIKMYLGQIGKRRVDDTGGRLGSIFPKCVII